MIPVLAVATLQIPGMKADWALQEDALVVTLTAETTGWMVVGFNRDDAIVGADLKFVRVVDGVAELYDHHVIGIGDHRPDAAPTEARILSHRQREGTTEVTLRLPLEPSDPQDLRLPVDEDVWMILAWSVSPDLEHHSRVRRHHRVRLGR